MKSFMWEASTTFMQPAEAIALTVLLFLCYYCNLLSFYYESHQTCRICWLYQGLRPPVVLAYEHITVLWRWWRGGCGQSQR